MSEKQIVLAGGCFWAVEHLFRSLPGVLRAESGYANGRKAEWAQYDMVCTGLTGFREAVRVTYDPERISLRRLLFTLFCVIDPAMYHRQGMDMGSQYQSGVYWSDPADEAAVLAAAELERPGHPGFCTELGPLTLFCTAEEYHQRYLEKNPGGYCHISPAKMAALRAFPYTEEAYDCPAQQVLAAWREQRDLP